MILKPFHRAGLLVAFLLLLTVGQSWAELPPEAQAAVKKGILAAKEGEWMIAIQSFQDARKIAPDAPEIYYNLGLAESKVPGRELRAIAWFGAYLAATTNAPNAAAVNDAIAGLQIKNQGNLNRLIKSVQDAASKISYHPGEDYYNYNCDIAGLWVGAGDLTAALKTVDSIQSSQTEQDKSQALFSIITAQAKAGDIEGAQKTTDLLQNAYAKSGALKIIAEAQIKAGDIAGAQKTADLIQDAYRKSVAQKDIAGAQIKAGDIAGAQKTTDLIQDPFLKRDVQSYIAYAQVSSTAVYDWLYIIDDNGKFHYYKAAFRRDHDCPLNTDPFLDLAGYLTAQHSDDPKKLFNALYYTAREIINVQRYIDRMLKQQAKQQAKP